jgi:hypothetical protein
MNAKDYQQLFNYTTTLAGILASSIIITLVYYFVTFMKTVNFASLYEKEPATTTLFFLILTIVLIYCLWKTAVMLFKLGGNK